MAVIQQQASKKRRPAKSSGKKRKPGKKAHPAGEYLYFLEAALEDFYNTGEEKVEFLEGGILVMHSPPNINHERIFVDLLTNLNLFVKSKNSGEVLGSKATIVLGNHRFEPDIIFIAKDNPGEFGEVEFFGIPDLVVEIISKTTGKYDLKIKREIYQEYKIKEIYFVDYRNKTLLTDILENNRYTTHTLTEGEFASKVLPGFAIKCYG